MKLASINDNEKWEEWDRDHNTKFLRRKSPKRWKTTNLPTIKHFHPEEIQCVEGVI